MVHVVSVLCQVFERQTKVARAYEIQVMLYINPTILRNWP